MNVILWDDASWDDLLPLTYTRPVSELRVGIRTIREKWEDYLGQPVSQWSQTYLREKFPLNIEDENLVVPAGILPSEALVSALKNLKKGDVLWNDGIIGFTIEGRQLKDWVSLADAEGKGPEFDVQAEPFNQPVSRVRFPADIFALNGEAIADDFLRMTAGRESAPLSDTNRHIGDNLFIEPGAKVEGAMLNSTTGPIYIGRDAEVMEGSLVRGALALCEHGVLKLGAKIYGPTTIGPWSKVGGEVSNSVIQGYSNKGHDGFLGNSVLGEWCNLGADTNTSNLKNNYAMVRLWHYPTGRFKETGRQFCGLIMGDHSKCGINTMFNTGTVVGVSANIFGSGFPRNFVASFSWGGAAGFSNYRFDKAMEVHDVVMKRRSKEMNAVEMAILQEVFDRSAKYRK